MNLEDIESNILCIEEELYHLRMRIIQVDFYSPEYTVAVNNLIESENELKSLKEKLKLNTLRKEKLDNLNNVSCH